MRFLTWGSQSLTRTGARQSWLMKMMTIQYWNTLRLMTSRIMRGPHNITFQLFLNIMVASYDCHGKSDVILANDIFFYLNACINVYSLMLSCAYVKDIWLPHNCKNPNTVSYVDVCVSLRLACSLSMQYGHGACDQGNTELQRLLENPSKATY